MTNACGRHGSSRAYPQIVPVAPDQSRTLVKTRSAPRLTGTQPEDIFESWCLDSELKWPYGAFERWKQVEGQLKRLEILEGSKPQTVAAVVMMHLGHLKPMSGVAPVTYSQMSKVAGLSVVTLRNSYKKFKEQARGRIEGT